MPCCILKDCINYRRKSKLNKTHGVTYHRFLPDDSEKYSDWVQFVRLNRKDQTWFPTPFTTICSLHFIEAEKYKTKTGRIYLMKHAVPKIDASLKLKPVDNLKADTPEVTSLKNRLVKEISARTSLERRLASVKKQNKLLKKKCQFYKSKMKEASLSMKPDDQEAEQLTQESEQSNQESEQSNQESEQSNQESEQSNQELEQSTQESEQSNQESEQLTQETTSEIEIEIKIEPAD